MNQTASGVSEAGNDVSFEKEKTYTAGSSVSQTIADALLSAGLATRAAARATPSSNKKKTPSSTT